MMFLLFWDLHLQTGQGAVTAVTAVPTARQQPWQQQQQQSWQQAVLIAHATCHAPQQCRRLRRINGKRTDAIGSCDILLSFHA